MKFSFTFKEKFSMCKIPLASHNNKVLIKNQLDLGCWTELLKTYVLGKSKKEKTVTNRVTLRKKKWIWIHTYQTFQLKRVTNELYLN